MVTSKRYRNRSSLRRWFNFTSKSSRLAALVVMLGVAAIGIITLRNSFASSVPICEGYAMYCVGAPSLGLGDYVKETNSGRDINIYKTSVGYYRLEFSADTSKCIGIDNNEHTIVKNCTGNNSSYTGWYKIFASNGYIKWQNRSTSLYLTGHGNGDRMFLAQPCNFYPCYQSFDY